MWTNVIGQSRVKRILRNALELGMLPSAYLFSGPEGTGKDAVALELAKAVNCLGPHAPLEACDECASCISIATFTSSAVNFVYALPSKKESKNPDSEPEIDLKPEDLEIAREQVAAKIANPYHNIEIPRAQLIAVDQIRELRLYLSRSLAGGRKGVTIISEADMMNKFAQNAFLKTLEEPHPNSLIILTSSNEHRFYPTILSRCQNLRFDGLQVEEISTALVEREELPQAQADFLARLAAGSYSRARAMIGEDVQEMRNQIVSFMRHGALSRSRKSAAQQIDQFLPRGGGKFLEKRQAVEQRLTLLTLWLRDALALSANADEREIVNLDQKEDLEKFVGKFSDPRRIISALTAVDRAMHLTKLQVQLRPVMLQLVMELEEALV